MVKETVTIERGADAYNGVGTVEVYDPTGMLVATLPDSTHAVRIKARARRHSDITQPGRQLRPRPGRSPGLVA